MTGQEVATVDDYNDKFSVRHTNKIEPFIPDGFASVLKFAELIAISGMAPKGLEKADKVAVAIFHGLEVGFTPMAALQSIAVINGRPSIWGDGALAMVRASGLLEDIEETYSGGDLWLTPPEFDDFGKQTKPGKPNPEYTGSCKTLRKGAKRPVIHEFSVLDAMTAGLWNKEGPWRTNPKRMLKMRARGFNLRDEFTDVMRGLVLAEEAQDYDVAIEHAAREEPPEDPTAKQEVTAPAAARKPRKAKESENKYQADAKENVEEAEVLGTKEAIGKVAEQTSEEDPPADTSKSKAEPEKKPAAVKDEPAKKAAADPRAEAIAFRDALLEEIGPDKPLKDYVTRINDLLMQFSTFETMKAAWAGHDRLAGLTKSQEVFRDRMRDYHKARIENIGKDDEPPADETGKGSGKAAEFDYSGFLHELDVRLGAQKKPEAVNKVYAEITDPPIKAGIITAEQIESDLKPLLATHLERTDFGN